MNITAICPINTFSSSKSAAPLTPPNSSLGEHEDASLQERYRPSWLKGRKPELYPTDENLPWHFSWIDDGSIGGSSVPSERYHWSAMVAANIGLVVNLTETPIRPPQHHISNSSSAEGQHVQVMCKKCDNVPEMYDENMFEDVEPHDEIEALFLPVQDGNIPRWEQLASFLTHAKNTIAAGKRVVVHCQGKGSTDFINSAAGVGRTGTFLAVYLMDKYQCSASEALTRLRHDRPQSMQFDRLDWQSAPFRFSDPAHYCRNYVQERLIELYHNQFIAAPTTDNDDAHHISDVGTELGAGTLKLIDCEIERKVRHFQANPGINYDSGVHLDTFCFICSNILSIGPVGVSSNMANWPLED